jgi:two-component system, OmpR family, response regulator
MARRSRNGHDVCVRTPGVARRYTAVMSTPLALVVEDDEHIAAIVAVNLRDLGFEVRVARDGLDALEMLRDRRANVVILDVMLPRMDGFAVCQEIRRTAPYVPILMLTARGDELDRLLGLELGADDYLTKPFSVRELIARVKAVLRRMQLSAAHIESPEPIIRSGDFVIDRARHVATLSGRALTLTVKEMQLLTLFAQHPGRAFTRIELMHLVWGYAHDADAHTVNSHINRLRAKIEGDPARPRYILTVRGIGYKLAESGDAAGD